MKGWTIKWDKLKPGVQTIKYGGCKLKIPKLSARTLMWLALSNAGMNAFLAFYQGGVYMWVSMVVSLLFVGYSIYCVDPTWQLPTSSSAFQVLHNPQPTFTNKDAYEYLDALKARVESKKKELTNGKSENWRLPTPKQTPPYRPFFANLVKVEQTLDEDLFKALSTLGNPCPVSKDVVLEEMADLSEDVAEAPAYVDISQSFNTSHAAPAKSSPYTDIGVGFKNSF